MASKPASWDEIRAAANAFVAEWRGEVREKAEAQSFWNDWFAVFGIHRRRVATFEAAARRVSTGGTGAIDVLWPGHVAVEHKSAGKDLSAAVEQALDYLVDLDEDQVPRLVIACDFARFLVHDLDTGERWDFALEEFPLVIERFGFLAGYQQREFDEEPHANVAAAELMAQLFDDLNDGRYPAHDLRQLLTRLLFLLFGDDTGIWEKGLFQEFLLNRTAASGADVGGQLTALFEVLDTPEEERPLALTDDLAQFPHINGHLFEERLRTPYFTPDARTSLLRCCAFDWGTISPAVFGSMFQAVMTDDERRAIGAHYTSERNILKLIRPLFMDELRGRFERGRNNAVTLRKLRNEMEAMRFFDPACGCGNFLVIAYRELRRLELDILVRLRDLDPTWRQTSLDAGELSVLDIDQFYGIEIEEFPVRIAEVAMYLVDHSENMRLSREFGLLYMRFPIRTAATIRFDNACRIDWAEVLPPSKCSYVLGNPPFVGMSRMDEDQQRDNRRVFEELAAQTGTSLSGLRTGRLDYVACWYAKAFAYMVGTQIRAAFVSTNSITQGEQARSMGPLLERLGFEIDFAHRSFRWTSEARGAAVVTVVVIGFSASGLRRTKLLFDYPDGSTAPSERTARHINWYLADGASIYPAKRTTPLVAGLPESRKGSQPTDGGHLIVGPDEIARVRKDPIARKYLKPFLQAREMLRGQERWCLWLVDASPEELRGSTELHRRLQHVQEARLLSKTESVREKADTPALFTQRRQPTTRYLAFPEVSSERRRYIPAAYLEPQVVAGNKLIVFPNADLWLFGVLQSSMFMVWVKTMAGRMKSDISISPDLTYCTFPFPPGHKRRIQIEAAAQAVLNARAAHPSATLADLYDPVAMPADLVAAHRLLDRAVEGALRPRKFTTDGERLSFLLAEYGRRIDEETLIAEAK